MELPELLNIIKTEFPDKSIDISESMDLLLGTVEDIVKLVTEKMFESISERDFKTMEHYGDLIKDINVYENKIDKIINLTRVDPDENTNDTTDESIIKEFPNYEEYLVDNKIEHTLYENFTHIRPFGFKLNEGELIETKTWQEVLLKTCEKLICADTEKFLSFENKKNMNGKKNKYFSTKADNLRKPEIIGNKLYVETNMSGNAIRNLIVKILKEFNIKISDYKVYFRADYTNINK